MSDETARESVPADAHAAAAGAFVDRARSRHAEDLVELYVFGSTVRGEADGRSSGVDDLLERTRQLVSELASLCVIGD